MKKNLFHPLLWGVLILSTLSSCRTEDGAITQKQVEDKRFAVFVPKSGKSVNYADGFAFLMKRYDGLHKTNLSGINNKPIIGTIANADKTASITQDGQSYVEFNVKSQIITEQNGDKWIVFPKVQGNRVIGLVSASLTEKGTYVRYQNYNEQDELYKLNVVAFQESLNKFQQKFKVLALSASINPVAGFGCRKEDGEWTDCGIDEVIITVPRPNPGTTNPSGPGGGGGGCQEYANCIAPGEGGGGFIEPLQDPCSRAQRALSAANVKSAIQNLKDRMNDPNRPNNNEQLHVIKKDGNTDVKEGKQDHVEFSPDIYTKGSVHNHDKLGYPMFPPHDINSFINTARVQNYPPDPNDPTDKTGEAFLGIVTPDYNYFMIFNGTKDDIPPMYGAGVVNGYQTSFRRDIQDMQMHNVKITDQVLQKLFFDYLDKMGLSGKVSLIKQINGNNYPITKNSDGTINNNNTNPCKN
ncbi:hypothetical protein LX74_03272 [Elizabethkingia miricola]|uniref:Lipoprotein n=1 Tax=Elizabethkingia miricola TaxID=172045 RepID=A0ABY3NCU7_ELIMR|nr:hypothetical protein [Elizabethkingia miricola]TYO88731.1 hypothetical protein LX74_03272 [Elizabethkingia miricola]